MFFIGIQIKLGIVCILVRYIPAMKNIFAHKFLMQQPSQVGLDPTTTTILEGLTERRKEHQDTLQRDLFARTFARRYTILRCLVMGRYPVQGGCCQVLYWSKCLPSHLFSGAMQLEMCVYVLHWNPNQTGHRLHLLVRYIFYMSDLTYMHNSCWYGVVHTFVRKPLIILKIISIMHRKGFGSPILPCPESLRRPWLA